MFERRRGIKQKQLSQRHRRGLQFAIKKYHKLVFELRAMKISQVNTVRYTKLAIIVSV